jgi:hypothetical protein
MIEMTCIFQPANGLAAADSVHYQQKQRIGGSACCFRGKFRAAYRTSAPCGGRVCSAVPDIFLPEQAEQVEQAPAGRFDPHYGHVYIEWAGMPKDASPVRFGYRCD